MRADEVSAQVAGQTLGQSQIQGPWEKRQVWGKGSSSGFVQLEAFTRLLYGEAWRQQDMGCEVRRNVWAGTLAADGFRKQEPRGQKPGKQEHALGLCAPGHMPTLPGMSSLLCQDSVEYFFQETSWNDSFLSFLRPEGQHSTK